MNTNQVSTTAVLKALADDTRLSIVRKLVSEGCEVASGEIVASCATFHELSQPAMSHHFSRLVGAGILTERKQGVEKHYQLNHELLVNSGILPEKL